MYRLIPRLPKLRVSPEPRVECDHRGPQRIGETTPGTQLKTSLIVFAGPFLNSVSGTTSTPPGVRSMLTRACSVVGAVKLLGAVGGELAGRLWNSLAVLYDSARVSVAAQPPHSREVAFGRSARARPE